MKAEHHPILELALQVARDAIAKTNWWFHHRVERVGSGDETSKTCGTMM